MDRYDIAQAVLKEIDQAEGRDSKDISFRLSEVTGSEITTAEVYKAAKFLEEAALIAGAFATGRIAYNLKMTPRGRSVLLRQQTVREYLIEFYSPATPTVTNAPSFNNSTVQYAQDNRGQMEQINSLSLDLSGLLQVMREHGDIEAAAVVEELNESQDPKGVLQKLLERFGGKVADSAGTATGTAIVSADYAQDVLPHIVNLLGQIAPQF